MMALQVAYDDGVLHSPSSSSFIMISRLSTTMDNKMGMNARKELCGES